jgi:pimeloyl-ACP methyl ester carboxylesterase
MGKLLAIGYCLFAGITYAAGQKILSENLDFSECSIGSGAVSLAAQCATLTVQLDSRPDSETQQSSNSAKAGTESRVESGSGSGSNTSSDGSGRIELSIARIPARRQSDRQDAFTLISGGPGQSAIESFPSVSFAFRHIMRNHDVILIDQRGTGGSAKLVCESASDSLGLDRQLDLGKISEEALECRESLAQDPSWFTTSMAVHDLEFVRQQLGVSQWNMYGISYGTRVAMHYLRRYPESIRTLMLDAVVPPSVSLGPDISRLSQRALDLIFKRCVDDQGCFDAFGDLTEPTMALLDSLDESPKSITFEDIATGSLSKMDLTRQHLAVTIRLMSYSAQTAAILPSMLHDAIVNQNFAPLARQAKLQTQSLGNSLANGMHQAIICTEDAPFVRLEENADEPVTYLGEGTIESLLASCKNWPPGYIDADFKEPVVSDAPVLILSGEADPVTPPNYGESITPTLSNSRHIINSDQGHMQAPFGCMPVLLAKFVSTADAKNLNVDCLKRLRVTPFFVDANGPLP